MTDDVKRRLLFIAVAAVGGYLLGSIGFGVFVSTVIEAGGADSDFGPSPKAGLALAGLAVLSIVVDWINES